MSSPSAPSDTVDPTLAAEQRHLADARAALARMRARAEALDSAAAGDWVSRKFLESAFEQRRKALADDPTEASTPASPSTSAAGTSTTTRASRWWSTGARR